MQQTGGNTPVTSIDREEGTSNRGRHSTCLRLSLGQVVRGRQEVDDRMKEFFKRVNNNDPREVSSLTTCR